jgi:hypothetical protein
MEKREEARIPFDQSVELTVLSDEPVSMHARISNLSGRGMRVVVDDPIPLDTAVRIDMDNSLILGEVCYCERIEGHWAVGVEMEHSLSDLRGLCQLVSRLLQEEHRAARRR